MIARSQVRQRCASYLALALVVALGGGAALGAAIAEHRTDRAYPDYVERAEVGTLGVNPSLPSVAMNEAMRSFDGVVAMHSSALLFAAVGAIPPAPMSELMAGDPDEQSLQVLGSPDGRFTDADRPVVTEGGLPIGDHEVFVNAEEREVLERKAGQPLAVGDTIDLTFWWSGLELAITDPSTVVEPIGVEEVRVAGFGHLPDEVLPDELYPRQRVIVSADLARKYSCTADFRADMTDDEAAAAAFPPTCAQQYWFYSFELDGLAGRRRVVPPAVQ